MTESRVDYLLRELNLWERKYGLGISSESLATTGEAPARIAEIKAGLQELGVRVEWNGKEYLRVMDEDGEQ
jgi:hypothetical protein